MRFLRFPLAASHAPPREVITTRQTPRARDSLRRCFFHGSLLAQTISSRDDSVIATSRFRQFSIAGAGPSFPRVRRYRISAHTCPRHARFRLLFSQRLSSLVIYFSFSFLERDCNRIARRYFVAAAFITVYWHDTWRSHAAAHTLFFYLLSRKFFQQIVVCRHDVPTALISSIILIIAPFAIGRDTLDPSPCSRCRWQYIRPAPFMPPPCAAFAPRRYLRRFRHCAAGG